MNIAKFMKKYKGKKICFADLKNKNEKTCFVYISTLNYFMQFLGIEQAQEQAKKNTQAHKQSKFMDYPLNKTLIITNKRIL